MSSNMKAFSITHIISVIVGGATVIAVSAIEFIHNPNFSPLYAFLQTSSYAGVIGYYATSLKASASGISETTTPK
jgi:hypothetical protein